MEFNDGHAHTDSDESNSEISELDEYEHDDDIIEQLLFNAYINDIDNIIIFLPIKRKYDKYIINPCRKN